jgi:hypothetical protein
MVAPLYPLGFISDPSVIAIALVLGFCFGYLVESVGFANARNFTAAFYGPDRKTFEVLFTAILTAMILTYLAFYLGLLDISLVPAVTLNLGAQIPGGLLLGAGLVIGGYCPGTDIVAAMTRKYDAWVFLLGSLAGILLYAEVFPYMSDFVRSWNFGKITLGDLFGVSYGVAGLIAIVFTIVFFAVVRALTGKVYANK